MVIWMARRRSRFERYSLARTAMLRSFRARASTGFYRVPTGGAGWDTAYSLVRDGLVKLSGAEGWRLTEKGERYLADLDRDIGTE